MEATEKMYNYAKTISKTLNVPEPDYENFYNTSDFISKYNQLYKKQCYRKKVEIENINPKFKYKKELIRYLEQFYEEHGCYVLWNKKDIVYIGKSINLAERVISSIQERNKSITITGLTLILTKNEADTHILEPILITEFKPILNTEFYCKDNSTKFKSKITYAKLKENRIILSKLKGEKDYERKFCVL